MRISKSTHVLSGAGYHTLKFCMVDPGIVLEKLLVKLGEVRPELSWATRKSTVGSPEDNETGSR